MFPIKYINGNYEVRLYQSGTKIRLLDNKYKDFEPEFAECIDITITERCENECPFCYLGCDMSKQHPDLNTDGINTFIQSLHSGTEVAINLNDVLQPGLKDFLTKLLRRGVVTNATISMAEYIRHREEVKALIDEKLIHGLGISLTTISTNDITMFEISRDGKPHNIFDIGDLTYDIRKNIPHAVFHIVAGLFDKREINIIIEDVIGIFFVRILLLGYKETGRGKDFISEEVRQRIDAMKEKLPEILKQASVVSFDNLALEQLDVKRLFSDKEWHKMYMGDEGQFTYYVNLSDMTYGINSMSSDDKRLKMEYEGYDSIKMFKRIRQK